MEDIEARALRAFCGERFPEPFRYGDVTLSMNGHVVVLRAEGPWRDLMFLERQPTKIDGSPSPIDLPPLTWIVEMLAKGPPVVGDGPRVFGMDPSFFALVHQVEKAATKIEKMRAIPAPGERPGVFKDRVKKIHRIASFWWTGSSELDPLAWQLSGFGVEWLGLMMPRRL